MDQDGDFNEYARDGAIRNDIAGQPDDDSPDNPTESGLTDGGTGTAVHLGREDSGGPEGAGGGLVERVGGIGSTGGASSGTISSGTGIPPRPDTPEDAEERI